MIEQAGRLYGPQPEDGHVRYVLGKFPPDFSQDFHQAYAKLQNPLDVM